MKETYRLAKLVCGIDVSVLTEERFADIRYKFLDWYGCAVGAAESSTAKKLCKAFRTEAGQGRCSVFCSDATYPVLTAAFLNGAESHILECDDVHKTAITHPGIIAITAALTVAETYKKSFGEFALGVVAGYEVMIRLGNALNPSHYDYWHTTGTCGTFAAAAVAGKMLDFTPDRMEQAFGIAATMASGLVCEFGTDAKLVTVGNAIRNGIQAAQLAAQGINSCTDVIERAGGYGEAVSARPDLQALTVSARPMIDTACYKIYASCGHTHSALDALFSLLQESPFCARDVEQITVSTYTKAAELTGAFKAQSASEAKFSLPFCIAAGVIYGSVSVHQFEPEVLQDKELSTFAEKISVQADPNLDAEYPVKRPEHIKIALRDGRVLQKTVQLPLGKPEYSFIENKFLSLAEMTVSRGQALDMMWRILSAQADTQMQDIIKHLRGTLYYGK